MTPTYKFYQAMQLKKNFDYHMAVLKHNEEIDIQVRDDDASLYFTIRRTGHDEYECRPHYAFHDDDKYNRRMAKYRATCNYGQAKEYFEEICNNFQVIGVNVFDF